jgi:hypothetical protein
MIFTHEPLFAVRGHDALGPVGEAVLGEAAMVEDVFVGFKASV